jgi:hypothetical protein
MFDINVADNPFAGLAIQSAGESLFSAIAVEALVALLHTIASALSNL